MKLINKTKEQITLEIVDTNGNVDSINIQPQGRVTVPEGFSISESKLPQYAQVVQMIS
jgi:hypothetical protein